MNAFCFGMNDRCLLVAPHPDDEVIGCGGTLLKYSNNFDVVVLASSGVGKTSDLAMAMMKTRIAEFEEVMKKLGIRRHWIFETFGNPPMFDQIRRLTEAYCAALKTAEYDYIFLPHEDDGHPEHQLISREIMRKVIRRNGFKSGAKICFYEIWSPLAQPTHWENISKQAEEKKKLIRMYPSQLKGVDYVSRILALNHYRAIREDYAYAEAFRVVPVEAYLEGDKKTGALAYFKKGWKEFAKLLYSRERSDERRILRLGGLKISYPLSLSDKRRRRPKYTTIIMTPREQEMLKKYVAPAENYLEFGAGGSTYFTLMHSQAKITTVESDAGWLNKMREYRIIREAEKNGRLQLRHADIGPVSLWGKPVDPSKDEKFPAYSSKVFEDIDGQKLDVVLVDGRFRVACILQTMLHASPKTLIIVHDFWAREHYYPVLEFLDCVDKIDSMAVFTVKPNVNRAQLTTLWEQYCKDWR